MRRRRSTKKSSIIQTLIVWTTLVVVYITFQVSGSWKMTAISLGVFFGCIIALAIVWSIRHQLRLLRSGISDIDKMTGVQFEEYLKTLFTKQGFKVSLTPGSGDYGADLILKNGSEVIVVQAKRYRNSVGVKAVQEVIPAINLYKANAAWVITNSVFTRQALHLAKHNNVRMIDRKALIALINHTKRQERRRTI